MYVLFIDDLHFIGSARLVRNSTQQQTAGERIDKRFFLFFFFDTDVARTIIYVIYHRLVEVNVDAAPVLTNVSRKYLCLLTRTCMYNTARVRISRRFKHLPTCREVRRRKSDGTPVASSWIVTDVRTKRCFRDVIANRMTVYGRTKTVWRSSTPKTLATPPVIMILS